jgi:hypothetical protein
MDLNIHVHECGPAPGQHSLYALLENIMATLQDLQTKVDAQSAQLAALRTYVTGIETQVRALASGEVLSATVQAKVDALVASIDANSAAIAAAGDGDITT